MTQLTINGTAYPETSKGRYKCYPIDTDKVLRMAKGRQVTEVGYSYMRIEYSYDYFPEELKNTCLTDLRSGSDLTVTYLADDGSGYHTDTFKCVSKPRPNYMFSRGGVAYYNGISFALEGVNPLA